MFAIYEDGLTTKHFDEMGNMYCNEYKQERIPEE